MRHAGLVFASRSRIGRILLIVLSQLWLRKIPRGRQKTRLFSPPRLHGPEAGGVHVLDFGCSSRPFTCEFLLQDLSPARHLDSGLTTVLCPSSSFSPSDNEFIQFSHSRHSVFDYATRHTPSSFVDAHCAVFSSRQFNYAGLRIPVPSRLNIPVWHALL